MGPALLAPTRPPGAPAEVLLIEDNADVAGMYRLALELGGCHVTVAADGETGLAAAGAIKPDVLFLDLRLPNMQGLDVLEQIRRRPETQDLRVVILSNSFSQAAVQRSRELGALTFLIKNSILPADIVAGVARWTGRRPDQLPA